MGPGRVAHKVCNNTAKEAQHKKKPLAYIANFYMTYTKLFSYFDHAQCTHKTAILSQEFVH
jgi:hypothetical protein